VEAFRSLPPDAADQVIAWTTRLRTSQTAGPWIGPIPGLKRISPTPAARPCPALTSGAQTGLNPGDIVIAAFPGARITKTRPAVVLSTAVYQRIAPTSSLA